MTDPPATLDELLSGTAASWVKDGQRWHPDDIEAAVVSTANRLTNDGVGPGDPVPWQPANNFQALARYRACWRVGGVAAPMHPRAEAAEMVSTTATLGTAALPDDAAVVLFTAGSTGGPKGVVHTHAGLVHKTVQMRDVHGLTPDDVVLMPAPLSHMSGLLNGLLVPGAIGMTTVLMDRWDPALALEAIEREQVTFMVGPPTFFLDLWQSPHFSPARVVSLRLVSTGGTGITPAFVDEAIRQLDCIVKRTYGSTEAPTVATTPQELHGFRRSATSDGVALPGVELVVVEPTTGSPQPAGTAGELWVRGPELFWGYLEPDQTAAAMTPEGWFRTGDLATIDDEGWLTIVGRLKEIIIRGGENIAAGEVEAVLESHPAVAHAVAIGEPDDRLGERVVAFVVLAPVEPGSRESFEGFDLDECVRWFEDRGAARFKTPERVVILDAIPTLPSGKPDRAALRKRR